MTENVLHEISPYAWVHKQRSDTHGRWQWATVMRVLQRFEETGELQESLPPHVQRPGALVGLTIGLLVRQAALLHMHGLPERFD